MQSEQHQAICRAIRRVPKGRVATYGQIAKLAGFPRNARQVGFVLRNLPEGTRLPWYRIVNSRGEISERLVKRSHGDGRPESECEQRWLLLDEGVEFNENDRISLAEYQWRPRGS